MSLTVLCDFDGTITATDTADAIFHAFADASWRDAEALWEAGEIGSAECMRRQVELVLADATQLDAALDAIEIDPFFYGFAWFCAENGIKLTVVSDGVDYFIRRILSRARLRGLPIRANRLIALGDGRYTLAHPHKVQDCASGAGTCKCAIEAQESKRRPTILIGDGRSDFCVSQEADIVFAKKSLLAHTAEQSIPAIPFETFADVIAAIRALLPATQQASAT